jgi:hypothetical protein
MSKDTVRITAELTKTNAEVLDILKEILGVSEGRSKADSILLNMILTKFRTQILNIFKDSAESVERREPNALNKVSISTSNTEDYKDTPTGRLPAIEF